MHTNAQTRMMWQENELSETRTILAESPPRVKEGFTLPLISVHFQAVLSHFILVPQFLNWSQQKHNKNKIRSNVHKKIKSQILAWHNLWHKADSSTISQSKKENIGQLWV